MAEYLTALPFRRRDGQEFEIDVCRLAEGDGECLVVRVWQNGVVINDPKAVHFTDAEAAYQAGLAFAKGVS